MSLVWCRPGSFTMGSPQDERGCDDDEDQVLVTLTRGFWIGKTEVTQGRWKQVMGTEPWHGEPFVKEGADYPAAYVSWEDAMEFCRRFTEQERRAGRLPNGWVYTLPTEAQWEYACRAGSTTAYCFGDEPSCLGDYAWFDDNAWDAGERYAHGVGLKRPNAWGLHDMHGNVWEWCRDGYGDKLPGGTDPEVTDGGSSRVYPSGCWGNAAGRCRSALRLRRVLGHRNCHLGFHVAAVPSGR